MESRFEFLELPLITFNRHPFGAISFAVFNSGKELEDKTSTFGILLC
jgi:hypothetical protein